METEITTYYLEMTDRSEFRRCSEPPRNARLVQAEIPSPELNRFLYTAVGGEWFWIDRLSWSYDRWSAHLERPEIEIWVLYSQGTPAGYIELEAQPGDVVEVAYLGLLPGFIGKGLGRFLLSSAIGRAWEIGGAKVWLHTCTLDHPKALGFYQASGLRVVKEEKSAVELPEVTPGPWPDAAKPKNRELGIGN